MNKFEQLIEYVINDETEKARELFHDIVVEKSRTIYEEIMTAEEESKDDEEKVEESMDETMGGDQADDLIDEIETEEEGISMEGEEEIEGEEEVVDGNDDDHADVGGNEDLEDRVVDLEDKLDELMAEFEELMGQEDEGDQGETDEIEMDDTEEEVAEGLDEAVDLKAAPKPVTSEEGGVNTKSTVAANAGAKGMDAKPVRETGAEEKGRPAPQAKDMGGTTAIDKLSPAPKAVTKEPAGINTKSIN